MANTLETRASSYRRQRKKNPMSIFSNNFFSVHEFFDNLILYCHTYLLTQIIYTHQNSVVCSLETLAYRSSNLMSRPAALFTNYYTSPAICLSLTPGAPRPSHSTNTCNTVEIWRRVPPLISMTLVWLSLVRPDFLTSLPPINRIVFPPHTRCFVLDLTQYSQQLAVFYKRAAVVVPVFLITSGSFIYVRLFYSRLHNTFTQKTNSSLLTASISPTTPTLDLHYARLLCLSVSCSPGPVLQGGKWPVIEGNER